MAITIFLYILVAPFIFKTFYPQYLDSLIYSQVFALCLIFAPSLIFGAALVSQVKKKELYIYKFSSAGIRIILLTILIPIYGLWGAVFAAIITEASSFFILFYLSKRVAEKPNKAI